MFLSRFAMPRASRLSLAVCAVLAANVAAPAFAQSTQSPTTARDLDRVIVIGQRPMVLPANRADVPDATLQSERGRSDDTARLLESIAGVNVQQAGGTSGLPVIHGMADDRNKVQVDGMESIASCPNHMNPPLSYIDPAKVGSVRVFAGVTPVSAGGDSIGGTIQVESQPPRFANAGEGWTMGGEAGLSYRSNGDARAADLSVHAASDRFNLRYSGSYAQSGNYRAGADFRNFTATGVAGHELPKDEVASTAYRMRSHLVGMTFKQGPHLIDLQLGEQSAPLQLYPNQRMDMLGNTQRRINLRYVASADWGSVEAKLSRERVRHHMDFGPDKQFWYGMQTMVPGNASYTVPCAPISPTCAAGMPMDTRSDTTSLSLAASVFLRPEQLLRVGAELQRYRLDDWWPASGGSMWPASFWNIRDGRRNRASLYAEWEGKFHPDVTGLFGLRASRVATSAGLAAGYDVDPAPPGSYAMTAADAARFNAGSRMRTDTLKDAVGLIRYTPSKQWDLELAYAHKERAPNLYERYAWSTWAMAAVMNNFVGDGNGYVGDQRLKPERADTVAITLDWHAPDRRWEMKFTPYVTRVRDYVDAIALTRNGPRAFNVLQFANQSALLRGADFSAKAVLGKQGDNTFTAGMIASVVRGRNTQRDDDLYNQMPANLKLTLGHRSSQWDNALEWVLVKEKNRLSALRNELRTPGYGLLNLRMGYNWRWLRIDAGVDNLLDKRYDLPLGGVYTAQGRTMGINAIPWGIPVPGPGRSFRIATRVSF